MPGVGAPCLDAHYGELQASELSLPLICAPPVERGDDSYSYTMPVVTRQVPAPVPAVYKWDNPSAG